MIPTTISERLLYNTVRLEGLDGSSGTGFFFTFQTKKGTVPVLITNKHVVNYEQNQEMRFHLHLGNDDGPLDENYAVSFKSFWNFHPSQDLCFTFVNPLFEEVKRITGKSVFFIPIEESLIYNQEKLLDLSALEEVVMIGYPIGLWDMIHNFPLFRKGYTGSHPAFDFNSQSVGVVDMSCFPGSSGSPIFILNENGYTDKKGRIMLGASRIIFLGVLFKGPTMDVNGNIIVTEIPTKQQLMSNSKVMVNLGYYIKSYEIFEFKKMIEEML